MTGLLCDRRRGRLSCKPVCGRVHELLVCARVHPLALPHLGRSHCRGQTSQVSSHRVIVQLKEWCVEGVVVGLLRTVPGLGELEELSPWEPPSPGCSWRSSPTSSCCSCSGHWAAGDWVSVRSKEESPGVQQVAVEEECITRRHLHVQVGAAKLVEGQGGARSGTH
jgi:hypothetical protein